MRRARGLSLIEAVVAIAVVAGMLAAALTAAGASGAGQFTLARREQAHLLARALMAEILRQAYQEPSGAVFGPETGEVIAGSRAAFDDVDDYHNWSECPPRNKDGTILPNLSWCRRSVVVEYVSPADLRQTVATNQGVKRITVKVHDGQKELARVLAVRTTGADQAKR
jgi:type II secretory pathway pseudopilin PulG